MINKNTSFRKFIQNIKGKKIIIWGLGLNRGGLEAAKYFAKAKANVTVVDLKSKKELTKSISELNKFSNINFVLEKQEENLFEKADLIIKNPAISGRISLLKSC